MGERRNVKEVLHDDVHTAVMGGEGVMSDGISDDRLTHVGDADDIADISAAAPALSLADMQKRRSHPVRTAIFIVLTITAILLPYWLGRMVAVRNTALIVRMLSAFTPQGIAFISWTASVVALIGLAFCIIESRAWWWKVIMLIGVASEQFIAGACLLKWNFWYSTYVLYGDQARLANAANLGILAAVIAAVTFAVVFVGLLVLIHKDSPLNVLTQGWAAMLMFCSFQVVALLIVMFGGLLTTF